MRLMAGACIGGTLRVLQGQEAIGARGLLTGSAAAAYAYFYFTRYLQVTSFLETTCSVDATESVLFPSKRILRVAGWVWS